MDGFAHAFCANVVVVQRPPHTLHRLLIRDVNKIVLGRSACPFVNALHLSPQTLTLPVPDGWMDVCLSVRACVRECARVYVGPYARMHIHICYMHIPWSIFSSNDINVEHLVTLFFFSLAPRWDGVIFIPLCSVLNAWLRL